MCFYNYCQNVVFILLYKALKYIKYVSYYGVCLVGIKKNEENSGKYKSSR